MLPYDDAFRQQLAEAVLAVQIDDSLAEAHAQIGDALVNLTWNWTPAGEELQRAVTLNPNSLSVRQSYGTFLVRVGRLPEAIVQADAEMKLDPLSSRTLHNAAFLYYYARQYDRSLAVIQEASKLDIDPNGIAFLLGQDYSAKGMYPQAVEEFQKLGNNPYALGHLGNAYARMGRSAEAKEIIAQLEGDVKHNAIGRYEIARVYAGLGDRDKAFDWLDKAYISRDREMTYLKADPCMDPLRSDPRFSRLLLQVGFPLG